MPFDFSNEQLFYYRNINIIKTYLKNTYDEIKEDTKKILSNIN